MGLGSLSKDSQETPSKPSLSPGTGCWVFLLQGNQEFLRANDSLGAVHTYSFPTLILNFQFMSGLFFFPSGQDSQVWPRAGLLIEDTEKKASRKRARETALLNKVLVPAPGISPPPHPRLPLKPDEDFTLAETSALQGQSEQDQTW